MRIFRIASLICLAAANRVAGQGLDIGGIDLRLGQNVEAALSALSSYQARYSDDSKAWYVSQRNASDRQLIGFFGAKDGKVSIISKSYRVSSPYESQRVYNVASRDLKRLGGEICTTREVEYTDNVIYSVETRCGAYRLTYLFPSVQDGREFAAGIQILVGGP